MQNQPDPPACFVINVFEDGGYASRLIGQLHHHHPTAQIIAITDGVPPSRELRLAGEMTGAMIIPGSERLKLLESGGRWVERMFLAFISHSKAPVFFKVDPDAYMYRAFRSIPQADWFGEISTRHTTFPYMRGGCFGMSRATVHRILNSDFLRDPEYTKPRWSYDRYGYWLFEGEEPREEAIAITDHIMGDVMWSLGIKPTQWDENCIRFREAVPNNEDLRYAIVHPVR